MKRISQQLDAVHQKEESPAAKKKIIKIKKKPVKPPLPPGIKNSEKSAAAFLKDELKFDPLA